MRGSTIIRSIRTLLASLIFACAAPAFAETGSLQNGTNFPITYQVGIPDEQGNVAWQNYTIGPCETHEYSWSNAGPPNLALLYPKFADSRRDENNKIILERNGVRMAPEGALNVFFLMGDQIWIDLTGNTPCNQQNGKEAQTEDMGGEAPPPSGQEEQPSANAGANTAENEVIPEQGRAYSTQELQDTLAWIDQVLARCANGEALLVPIAMAEGGKEPVLVPIGTDRFVQLLMLEVISGGLSELESSKLLDTAVNASRQAEQEMRRKRDRLEEKIQAFQANAPL